MLTELICSAETLGTKLDLHEQLETNAAADLDGDARGGLIHSIQGLLVATGETQMRVGEYLEECVNIRENVA